jgi:hypothetical protein
MVDLALLLAIMCVGAVGFTVVGVALVRPYVKRAFSHGHNETSAAIFTVAGTVYAVFLAFVVIAAWEAHDTAKANAAEEASLLATLYRGSIAMDHASGDRMRALVRQYTEAVVHDEWKIQARNGGTSEKARKAGLEMYRLFAAMPRDVRQDYAAINEAQLATLAQLQNDRNKRTLQAQEDLSPLIWATAIINGVIVQVMSFFLYADRHRPHVVMSSALAVMIVIFLYVISLFANPFSGLTPLQPDAFEHCMDVFSSVDRAL